MHLRNSAIALMLCTSLVTFAKANEGGSGVGGAAPLTPPAGDLLNGAAPLAPAGGALAAPPVNGVKVLGIVKNIPMPVKKPAGRGGQNSYPFDTLEIGDSFGLIGKTAKQMASTVSSANKRNYVQVKNDDGTPKFDVSETKDAAGNVVKTEQTAVMAYAKKFYAANVDPKTDPEGATVRIWRETLTA